MPLRQSFDFLPAGRENDRSDNLGNIPCLEDESDLLPKVRTGLER